MSFPLLSRREVIAGLGAAGFPRIASATDREVIVKPGDSIAAALAQAPAGTTRRLRLMAGGHGPLTLQSLKGGRLELTGEDGAVLGPTVVRGSDQIVFRNLAFRGEKGGATVPGLVLIDPSSRDILFERCSFATSDSVTGWSSRDWVDRPYPIGLFARGPQVSVKESRFFNLRNCLSVAGDGGVVQGCSFEAFGNDAIEFGANNLRIVSNRIRGGYHTQVDPLHADGIQGFPAPNSGQYQNILIDSNIIEFVGPGDYMQGITIFDGSWQNVRVTNNKVSVNVWNAIALYGISGVFVEGNIVSSTDPKIRNWIEVRASKTGVRSTDVVVRNNVAPLFKTDRGATLANNQVRLR
ncbi:right-handed parallel beta-helix repeat-containing protein [Methylobacterium sp. Leaf94]|uniref:right-handed parallel beta-helix repeat-containing protein n=1 Tax=Methylobacterium sp. Leaf94 TaxID=1736250 RepID=UPI0012E33D40|nr:right-handed parallel beta-helix repeat-containing protein [Methylobacterium sp. Leaf94]